MRSTNVTVWVVAALLTLGGCSGGGMSSRKAEYQKATTLPPLEVPPDLTAPAAGEAMPIPETRGVTLSQSAVPAPAARREVLPDYRQVRVLRDGDARWLVIDAPADAVWKTVRAFWQQAGFELKVDEPAIGVMETQWAENRADIPQDIIRRTLGKVLDNLYSSPTRDKFRVRLEPGTQPGTTELYLTHYGVEEVYTGGQTGNERGYWQRRPADPELASEMLNRLLVHFGMNEQKAGETLASAEQVPARARLQSVEGAPAVVVDEPFARAWRRTGLALERIGLVVEDRDRSQGIYYVRSVDPVDEAAKPKKGLFGLFGGGKDEPTGAKAEVVVQGQGEQSVVWLRDAVLGSRDNSDAAEKALQRLVTEMQ